MTTKHTPGPWETPGEDGGERVISYRTKKGKRYTLAHVYDGETANMEANARLIAAAPELLDALEGVLQVDCDSEDWHQDEAWERAKNAIAKAKGFIYMTPSLIIKGFSIAHFILDSLDDLCLNEVVGSTT